MSQPIAEYFAYSERDYRSIQYDGQPLLVDAHGRLNQECQPRVGRAAAESADIEFASVNPSDRPSAYAGGSVLHSGSQSNPSVSYLVTRSEI